MAQCAEDGIIAVATANGRGGIGVVRLSGPEAVVRKVFSRMTRVKDPEPRYAYYAPILDAGGGVIDRGVVIWFKAPHSYTGEDVLEFQAHGNPVILNLIIRAALEAGGEDGVRLAGPGEFTRRAFMNGMIDLAQAESVMDIVNANSEDAVRAANRSLSGEFSTSCGELEEALIALRTQVEAILDFPEEEIDFMQESRIREQTDGILLKLEELLKRAGQGNLLREGAVIALVGSPNVGKSSLLNRLSEREVAIVTDIPGTTRDVIENSILINGVLIRLVDTAGLRETEDIVESAGISRALAQVENADLVLRVVSCDKPESEDGGALAKIKGHLPEGIPVLTVMNKADLLAETPAAEDGRIWISAKFGTGIDALRAEILKKIGYSGSVQSVYLARRRHVESLKRARSHAESARELLRSPAVQLDLVAEELRMAAQSVGEITGEFSSDDLLGRIFSSFCIGK